jgi:hypothetical protein
MSETYYWENGERVPVYDPREEVETEPNILESPQLVVMRRLLGILKSSPHPGLTIDCLCLISGVCYDGLSMADIARKNKVSRATVSHRCVELGATFGIDHTLAMRSRKARENCHKARIKKIIEIIP